MLDVLDNRSKFLAFLVKIHLILTLMQVKLVNFNSFTKKIL